MHVPVGFDESQVAFLERVRAFAQPHRASYLEWAGRTDYPWSLLQDLAAAGLLGLGVSRELGGLGRYREDASAIDFGILQEELAYQNFYLAQVSYGTHMIAPLLDRHLPSPAREEWVTALLRAERIVGMAVTEPDSGTDAGALSTAARRVDGGWSLTGQKTSIGFVPHADAALVLARAEGEPGGITAFLVRMDSPGVHIEPFTDGIWKPIGRAQLTLTDVFVPEGLVVGPVGGGFRLVLSEFDVGRCVIPLMATAVGRWGLELAVEHAGTRTAFGNPIAAYQGVSFPLADGAARLESARWLAYRALSLAAQGEPNTTEAAMAKLVGVEAALSVLRDAIVVHGFRGLSESVPLQSMLRDVSGLEIGEGTPQLQRLLIARSLLGRVAG